MRGFVISSVDVIFSVVSVIFSISIVSALAAICMIVSMETDFCNSSAATSNCLWISLISPGS